MYNAEITDKGNVGEKHCLKLEAKVTGDGKKEAGKEGGGEIGGAGVTDRLCLSIRDTNVGVFK